MDLLKNLNNMIIAEEFFYKLYPDAYTEYCDIKNAMIEFAKLHTEQALKEASEQIGDYGERYLILNAYPLENIK